MDVYLNKPTAHMAICRPQAKEKSPYFMHESHGAVKCRELSCPGPEYGTTQGAWRGLLTEADHVADLHTVMAEKLMFEVHGSIKVW